MCLCVKCDLNNVFSSAKAAGVVGVQGKCKVITICFKLTETNQNKPEQHEEVKAILLLRDQSAAVVTVSHQELDTEVLC